MFYVDYLTQANNVVRVHFSTCEDATDFLYDLELHGYPHGGVRVAGSGKVRS